MHIQNYSYALLRSQDTANAVTVLGNSFTHYVYAMQVSAQKAKQGEGEARWDCQPELHLDNMTKEMA